MSAHNICFCGEIRKIICGYPLLSVAMLHVSCLSYHLSLCRLFNECPQHMFLWRNKKNINTFGLKKKSILSFLIVLGFNDTSTLEGHFVSSPREREKRDRRDSRRDKREGQGRKRNRNESEETEEIKTFPLYPYPLQG